MCSTDLVNFLVTRLYTKFSFEREEVRASVSLLQPQRRFNCASVNIDLLVASSERLGVACPSPPLEVMLNPEKI